MSKDEAVCSLHQMFVVQRAKSWQPLAAFYVQFRGSLPFVVASSRDRCSRHPALGCGLSLGAFRSQGALYIREETIDNGIAFLVAGELKVIEVLVHPFVITKG